MVRGRAMREFSENAYYLLVWRAFLVALIAAVLIVTRTVDSGSSSRWRQYCVAVFRRADRLDISARRRANRPYRGVAHVGAGRAPCGTGWPPMRAKQSCGNGIPVRKGFFSRRDCVNRDRARDLRRAIGIAGCVGSPVKARAA